MIDAGSPSWRRTLRAWLNSRRGSLRLSYRGGVPAGLRVYAVGDIHGQVPLLRELLELIEQDHQSRTPARTRLLLLGDFIDRGSGSARLLRSLSSRRLSRRAIALKGNHEAAMVHAVRGNPDAMRLWLTFGGAATLAGFGVDPADVDPGDPYRMIDLARDVVPKRIVNWLGKLPVHYQIGSYYFVHAGVRPGIALSRQRDEDKLWIREEFLENQDSHGPIIVHGHSIHEGGIDLMPNRIGIDTGAYRTGRLTALCLEGNDRWTIEVDRPDLIATPSYDIPRAQPGASMA